MFNLGVAEVVRLQKTQNSYEFGYPPKKLRPDEALGVRLQIRDANCGLAPYCDGVHRLKEASSVRTSFRPLEKVAGIVSSGLRTRVVLGPT